MKYPIIAFIIFLMFSCTGNITEHQENDGDSTFVETVEVDNTILPLPDTTPVSFTTQWLPSPLGDSFQVRIAEGFTIHPVATGMNRIRFMDMSPDGRLFLTDMLNLSDNERGKIFVLSDFDDSAKIYRNRITYLDRLRNPNSLAFYTDENGKEWLYIALTHQLVRYPYTHGSEKPGYEPEVLDTYPDHGLSYRYGGWHLTRTIQFGSNGKLYVSVGSSCNVCIEKEEERATIIEMNPDGSERRIFATGLRNAVGLTWANGKLYGTNMGADHLGRDLPDDVMFRIEDGKNYGWPFYYHAHNAVQADPMFDTTANKPTISEIEGAISYFGAHTAPLGIAWFGSENANVPVLQNYFLVAQHGSYTPTIGMGYNIQRVRENHPPEDFISGFLNNGKVHGRPCGIFSLGNNSFLFTDDKFGILYLVENSN